MPDTLIQLFIAFHFVPVLAFLWHRTEPNPGSWYETIFYVIAAWLMFCGPFLILILTHP